MSSQADDEPKSMYELLKKKKVGDDSEGDEDDGDASQLKRIKEKFEEK